MSRIMSDAEKIQIQRDWAKRLASPQKMSYADTKRWIAKLARATA